MEVAICPVCLTRMAIYYGPLSSRGPIGRYWVCENGECPYEGIQSRGPDQKLPW